MPHGTVAEFLQVVSQSKKVQFAEILSHHWHEPGDGTYNKTSRLGTRANPIFSPYPRVLHVLRQNALLGVSYEKMVNAQREREAARAMEALMADLPSFVKLTADVEPFLAGPLWGGKGLPDDEFPKMAVKHTDHGGRYIRFWPASDAETGKPIPNESKYYDDQGRELDFKTDLAEFWKPPRKKSKVQETEREISWSIVKFSNVVRINAMKMIWTFDGPEVGVPAAVAALA